MTRLPLLNPESAPEASRTLVQQALQNNGFLPNLIGVLANAPAALEAYFTVGGINARTSLSLAEREVVQLTAAHLHGCDFCVAGHSSVALRKAALPAPVVVALQHARPTGDAGLDAVQAFTRSVIEHRGQVPDRDLESFHRAGYTAQQALEVVLGVSLATLCNFANTLAASPVNPELQPYAAGTLEA